MKAKTRTGLILTRTKNIPLFIWILFGAVLINVIEAPNTIESVDAIRQNSSEDIKDEMLRYRGTYITHNLYAAVGEIASGADIVVSKERDLSKGSNIRSRLLALADINSIRVVKFDDSEIVNDVNTKRSRVVSGEVWDYPGYPRIGRPGNTWEIHYSENSAPETLLFISQPDDPQLIFIDADLLPPEVQSTLEYQGLKG